jgi:hypothetical protein
MLMIVGVGWRLLKCAWEQIGVDKLCVALNLCWAVGICLERAFGVPVRDALGSQALSHLPGRFLKLTLAGRLCMSGSSCPLSNRPSLSLLK